MNSIGHVQQSNLALTYHFREETHDCSWRNQAFLLRKLREHTWLRQWMTPHIRTEPRLHWAVWQSHRDVCDFLIHEAGSHFRMVEPTTSCESQNLQNQLPCSDGGHSTMFSWQNFRKLLPSCCPSRQFWALGPERPKFGICDEPNSL